MITFIEFLKNQTAGAFGKVRNNNPGTLAHRMMQHDNQSDLAKTQKTGKSTIQRMSQKDSVLPSGPTLGAAPGKQVAVNTNFGRKPLQFFRKEPKIKNVPIPKSLQ